MRDGQSWFGHRVGNELGRGPGGGHIGSPRVRERLPRPTRFARRLHMARMLRWMGLALVGSSAMGCVAQEKYNALKLDRDQYAQRLSSAEAAEQSAQAAADAYKKQLDALGQNQGNNASLVVNLTQQNADLQR